MMLKPIIASLSVLALVAGTPAIAQTSPAPSASRSELSLSQIEQRLTADGFRVFEIERYARSVEVKGLDRNGRCREMHLDPVTGAVLHEESDDDCYDDDRDGSRRSDRR
jgi:Peptidase propeptide and YPEB domain